MTDRTITGRVVGEKYRITGYQRAGRMGELYVARRVDTNELVTIKMLDPALFGEKEAVRRFERETRITSQLDNSCTLVVQDFGRTGDGLPWMALEYVEGDQLADLVDRAPLDFERAAYITAQIAMALSEAHSIGVVHRDISADNVLITTDAGQQDAVKVLDFGLSRLQADRDGEDTELTAVGVRIGNPAYMAPEYIEQHDLDHRADLYSLGILLYEMLTGSVPFTGRPYKIMDKHLTVPVPAPSKKVPGIPGWMDLLVADLTEKEPAQRIQSADAVIKEIEAGLGHRIQTVQTVAQAAPDVVKTPIASPDREAAPASPAPQVDPWTLRTGIELLPEDLPPEEEAEEPDSEPRPSAPEIDPVLQSFIEGQIGYEQAASTTFDPAESLVVANVAPVSVAARLGVERGWWVHLPDEVGDGMLDPRFWLKPAESRRLQFASPSGSKRMEVVISGADPGMDLMRSSAHVRKYYSPGRDAAPDALLDVWRQGDWGTLEELCWKTLSQQRGTAGALTSGLFSRFLGKAEIRVRNHPALLLYGAALIEQERDEEQGVELVYEYRSKYATQWPVEFEAIAHYYAGRHTEGTRDQELAADLHVQSWLRWPTDRAADRIKALTGQRPDTRLWYGRQFPAYNLDVIESRESVGLYETLERMEETQLLLVCMMGGFRGNVEYDTFLRTYLADIAHFAPFLAGVHVITHRTRRDEDKPEHYQAEDLLLVSNLGFKLLEDYRAFLQRTVKPAHVPTIYALDREGWVVHEGRLDSVGLWRMLETAAIVRSNR